MNLKKISQLPFKSTTSNDNQFSSKLVSPDRIWIQTSNSTLEFKFHRYIKKNLPNLSSIMTFFVNRGYQTTALQNFQEFYRFILFYIDL